MVQATMGWVKRQCDLHISCMHLTCDAMQAEFTRPSVGESIVRLNACQCVHCIVIAVSTTNLSLCWHWDPTVCIQHGAGSAMRARDEPNLHTMDATCTAMDIAVCSKPGYSRRDRVQYQISETTLGKLAYAAWCYPVYWSVRPCSRQKTTRCSANWWVFGKECFVIWCIMVISTIIGMALPGWFSTTRTWPKLPYIYRSYRMLRNYKLLKALTCDALQALNSMPYCLWRNQLPAWTCEMCTVHCDCIGKSQSVFTVRFRCLHGFRAADSTMQARNETSLSTMDTACKTMDKCYNAVCSRTGYNSRRDHVRY